MIDASATRRPFAPITRHRGSTTERGSSACPILYVPLAWKKVSQLIKQPPVKRSIVVHGISQRAGDRCALVSAMDCAVSKEAWLCSIALSLTSLTVLTPVVSQIVRLQGPGGFRRFPLRALLRLCPLLILVQEQVGRAIKIGRGKVTQRRETDGYRPHCAQAGIADARAPCRSAIRN
jgi:hypothetical protein